MKIDFDRINTAAIGCLESLLTAWFPGGKREGPEFKVGSLEGEPGRSLSISLRSGVWKDFSGDRGGSDLISLLAAIRGCDMGKAAIEIDEYLGTGAIEQRPVPQAQPTVEEWEPQAHAPEGTPAPSIRHFKFGEPTRTWEYTTAEGLLIGYICRFDTETGKEVLPYTWCKSASAGVSQWKWKAFRKPRPLYGLPRLADMPTAPVLIVEGEKCADAAQALLPTAVVVAWPGGSKAVRYVDLSPLSERRVTIWPDADQPGREAAEALRDILAPSAADVRVLNAPHDAPQGWDVADAIAEGWDEQRIKAFIRDGGAPIPTPEPSMEPYKVPIEADESRDPAAADDEPFRILGHANGQCYYLPLDTQAVMSLSPGAHRKLELLMLAPAHHWELNYPSKDGANWLAAANSLIQRSKRIDFDASMVRGRGAWLDDGRVIYHRGANLVVDGTEMKLADYEGRWTYEKGRKLAMEVVEPLTAKEAAKLIELAKCFQFRNALDPVLLAGWLAMAPICGALEWRPHLWLTGPSGTGKSWILDNIVRPALGNCALYVQSATTEAGIRQMLGCDALPVVFDEAETERDMDQKRMQSVLILARQASRESEGRIAKGSTGGQAIAWHIRSTFLFSSIATAAVQRADTSRITVLDLIPEHQRKTDRFEEAKAIFAETLADPKWCAALRMRCLNLMPVTTRNVARFKQASLTHLGSQRDSDQFGALLAGAFSLTSNREINPEGAAEFCARQDWSSMSSDGGDRDEANCLTHLLEAAVLADLDSGPPTRTTVVELCRTMVEYNHDSKQATAARAALERIGIAVQREGVAIANGHDELRRIYRETIWADKWKDQFKRLDGAKELPCATINGIKKRAVRLPLTQFYCPAVTA